MIDFTLLDLPGRPFNFVETYVYYDGPKAFALKSQGLPFYYYVNAVDEDEEQGSITALAVAVDEARFQAVRAGVVDFRDAFERAPEGSLFRVAWGGFDEPGMAWSTVDPVANVDVPAGWLPAARARLNLPTETAEKFTEAALLHLSDTQQRTIFAVEVKAAGTNTTSFPARNIGHLTIALHGTFDALGQEVAAGSDALKDIYPAVLGLRAASFVVVLGVETRAGMIEPVEVSGQIVDKLSALIEAVGSGELSPFVAAMHEHTQRTRNRFRDMLEALIPVGSGLSVSSVKAYGHQIRRVSATPNQVKAAVQALDEEQPEIQTIAVNRGVLMGLVLRLGRFEIVDMATGKMYRGVMTEDAGREANGFEVGDTSFVTATIRAEVAFAAEDELAGTKYWLESISRYSRSEEPPG